MVTMARLCKQFRGSDRLVLMRWTFACLSLCFATSFLSREFREWFLSNRASIGVSMSYQQEAVTHSIDNNIANSIVDALAFYDSNSTDEIPTACEFPKINPYEPSVMEIAGMDKKTLSCEGTFMPDLTYIEGGNKLKVNTSKVDKYLTNDDFKDCRYRNIYRHDTDDNDYKFTEWSESFTDQIELPKDAEFLKVECRNNKSEVVSNTFYALIPPKEQFSETDSLNFKKRQVMTAPKETLNIIMIGLDTLTRNQLLRGCNKTYSYLMNTLNSFDLTLHSQLGSNTLPNLIPLFTGHSEEEVRQWWSDQNHMDTFDLIWRSFEAAGYRTLFTEDWPTVGSFYYLRKGFRHQFARYNIRPLALAAYRDNDILKKSSDCIGNQVELSFHLDYLSSFLDTFSDKPVFAVAFMNKPAHEEPTNAKMFDEHILGYYKSWSEKGHLNRSVLISFSDHGVRGDRLRYSVNGHVESKTPYTIMTFPDWFLKKYPDVAANLKRNNKRLTSHFDTHATLLDLLYFRSNMPPPLPPLKHGISLFDQIPWDRTCKDALIPSDFCLCGYKGLEEVNLTSQFSKVLAELILTALNSKTDKNLCAVYKLQQIIHIHKISFNDDNSKGKRGTIVYKVKLEVNPGNALFEANVYKHDTSVEWKIGNEIERVNMYRGQADCLLSPTLRPFCYCKNMLHS